MFNVQKEMPETKDQHEGKENVLLLFFFKTSLGQGI